MHSHEALAARPRRPRRALDPRGRPRGPPQGLPRDPRPALQRARQARAAVRRGPVGHRHPLGLRGPRPHHRRLPGRQPDHPRRAPGMGKSALMANFAEYAALNSEKAVALFSLEMSESELAQRFIASQASIKGDDLRKGKVPPARWGKILAASQPAGGVVAVHRRLLRPVGARRAREDAAAGAAAGRRARARADRLPAADARDRRRPTTARSRSARSRAGSRRWRASSRCR